MPQRISQRTLLSSAIKTGLGLAICTELKPGWPALAMTPRVIDDPLPERLGFGPVVNGRATRMKVSGVEFYRTFIP